MKQERIDMSEFSWPRLQHRKWLKFTNPKKAEEPRMTDWQRIEHKKWGSTNPSKLIMDLKLKFIIFL
jgi:hypothetical protein